MFVGLVSRATRVPLRATRRIQQKYLPFWCDRDGGRGGGGGQRSVARRFGQCKKLFPTLINTIDMFLQLKTIDHFRITRQFPRTIT